MKLRMYRRQDTECLKNSICSLLKGKVSSPEETMFTVAFLVILKALGAEGNQHIIPPQNISQAARDAASACYGTADTDSFISLLLFYRNDMSFPKGVTDLVLSFSEIGDREKACVICPDASSVCDIAEAAESWTDRNGKSGNSEDASGIYRLADIYDPEASDITKMRLFVLSLLNINVKLSPEHTADIPSYVKYDFVFSNYFLSDRPYTRINPDFTFTDYPILADGASYEWGVHFKMTEMLSYSGRAVAVTTTGAVSNRYEASVREHFIRNGLVKTVIALPPKLFGYSPIPAFLIVFTHGNETVEFKDAREIFTPARRLNRLTEDDVSRIISMPAAAELRTDDVRFEEKFFSLNPEDYVSSETKIVSSVTLGDTVEEITRGMQLNADDFDRLEVKTSDYRYLRISDIQDGLINDSLPCLKSFPEGSERYRAAEGDIIIAKTGNPAKTAVIDSEHSGILITGNMYIIRTDRKKANPYFLLAFLSGETGQKLLAEISGGSTIKTISVSALKKMPVPLPDTEIQEKTGQLYREKLEEISDLRRKLGTAVSELKKIYT